MKREFWNMFFDLKVADYYYLNYCRLASRRRRRLSAILTVASMSFVGSWYFSQAMPWLWAILTVFCQIISVLQPFFPYEEQLHAADNICQDLDILLIDVEAEWLKLRYQDTPDDLDCRISQYRSKFNAIENRFSKKDTFPADHKLHRIAEENAFIYFKRFT